MGCAEGQLRESGVEFPAWKVLCKVHRVLSCLCEFTSRFSMFQTQPLTPSNGLDLHYSPSYKSPPPGGGHVTQPANHSISHSTSQQPGKRQIFLEDFHWFKTPEEENLELDTHLFHENKGAYQHPGRAAPFN